MMRISQWRSTAISKEQPMNADDITNLFDAILRRIDRVTIRLDKLLAELARDQRRR